MSEEAMKKRDPQVIDEKEIKDFLVWQWTSLTDAQFKLFLWMAQANNLNPFKREIYAIPYQKWNPETRQKEPSLTIVTWYQTYIERAESTWNLDWRKVDVHMKEDDQKKISHATVTIYRKDFKYPVEWTADIKEFAKTDKEWNPQWSRKVMPKFMIKKVAIAQWFRLAFPNELWWMPYMEEEMSVDSNEEDTISMISKEQQKEIEKVRWEFRAFMIQNNWSDVDAEWKLKYTHENKWHAKSVMITHYFDKDDAADLTEKEAKKFIKNIQSRIEKMKNPVTVESDVPAAVEKKEKAADEKLNENIEKMKSMWKKKSKSDGDSEASENRIDEEPQQEASEDSEKTEKPTDEKLVARTQMLEMLSFEMKTNWYVKWKTVISFDMIKKDTDEEFNARLEEFAPKQKGESIDEFMENDLKENPPAAEK